MIRITDRIWIGLAVDPSYKNIGSLAALKVTGILNVAQDFHCPLGWEYGFEHMQIGLLDGPGNPLNAYYAAVLALSSLLERHEQVIVASHDGGRSMAVVLMYMNAGCDRGWSGLCDILQEKVDLDLPVPNSEHRKAFDKMDWKLLRELMS